MNGLQFWARQHAEKYPDGREREIAYTCFIDGFRDAREKSAGLIEGFNNPKFMGVPLLIRVIGLGECDDHGVSIAMKDA